MTGFYDENYRAGQRIARLENELHTAKEATALLDRLQEPRVFTLPDGHGLIVGGRWDGWLCFKHPDGQWVTAQKLTAERQS